MYASKHHSCGFVKTVVPGKRLSQIYAALMLVFLGLVLAVCVTKHHQGLGLKTDALKSKVDKCWSKQCLKTATDLLQSLDPVVDPCKDFYRYACGGWIKSNKGKLSFPTLSLDRFAEVEDNIQKLLNDIMYSEVAKKKYYKIDAINKAFVHFESCLDQPAKNRRGAGPLAAFLKSNNLDSMISSQWNEEDFADVTDKLVKLNNEFAIFPFISVKVEADLRNSKEYVITLRQSDSFGISAGALMYNTSRNIKRLELYKKKMAKMLEIVGATRSEQLDKDLDEIINIEKENAKLTRAYYEFDKDKLYKKIAVKELERLTSSSKIDWARYLRSLFTGLGVNISPDYKIVVYDIDYLTNISSITASLSNRTFSNYFAWRLIDKSSLYLGNVFDDIERPYRLQNDQPFTKMPLKQLCFFELKMVFGMVLGRLLVEETLCTDNKKLVEEIVENFRSTLINGMRNLTWMEESSKLAAIDKAKSMIQRIGFPDFILRNKDLNDLYGDVIIDRWKYYENSFSIQANRIQQNIKKLGTVVDKSEWKETPVDVNAYYQPNANKIVFPAAILQPPFYNKDYLRASSYGAIGSIIGHEIVHGFDSKGREYDKDGNLLQWWTDNTTKAFQEKADCFVKQYNNLTYHRYPVNGHETLAENIADNAGVQYAFRAYKEWTEKHGREHQLRGTMLTNVQLFFISFAQNWCKIVHPVGIYYEVFGNHAPSPYRVNATLQNIPEFSEAFNCPIGSPMNPVHKCKIW